MRLKLVRQVLVAAAVLAATVVAAPSAGAVDPDVTPPTATIVTPQDGATYIRDASVLADYSCADELDGSGLASCVGSTDAGAAIDTQVLGDHGFTVTATDSAGNVTSTTATYTIVDDATAPTVTIATPDIAAIYAQGATVVADYSCADEPGGSGLVGCDGTVPDGAPLDTATPGPHSFSVTATDAAGNVATSAVGYLVKDTVAPVIAFAAPFDGARYPRSQAVAIDFSCADDPGGSGVSPGHCNGQSWIGSPSKIKSAPVGTPLDTAASGAHTFIVTATDDAGNTRTATIHYTVFVDVTPPTVTMTVPAQNAKYKQGAVVLTDYSCADNPGGLGLLSCIGPVPSGSAIDTATIGSRTFQVNAKDNAGNTKAKSVTYVVTDAIAPPPPTVNVPAAGATYAKGSVVTADYSCVDNDGGSGIKLTGGCVGTVANGAALSTASVGSKTFRVTATDNGSNKTVVVVSYKIK